MAGRRGIKRFDWTPFREEIRRLYCDELLSARMVHEKLQPGLTMTVSSLRAFIGREFGIRNMKQARSIAIAAGRAHVGNSMPWPDDRKVPKFRDKSCDHCKVPFDPCWANQRLCKTCAPDDVWIRRIRRYGVSKPDWESMLESQKGTCALCHRSPTTVDHCHRTRRVRGLLCGGCNFAMGRVDQHDWIDAARRYAIRQ